MKITFFRSQIFAGILFSFTTVLSQPVNIDKSLVSVFPSVQRSSPAAQVGNTYVVTNTNDSGNGSLRWAITMANSNAGLDSIAFSIGNGTQTIQAIKNLPFISDPVIIDGTTQPGFSGTPIIVLNGAASIDYGLRLTKGPTTVRGFVINGFPLGGISVGSAQFQRDDDITVEGCYVGTDVTGTQAVPNGGGQNGSKDEGGINVFFSGNNTIGSALRHNLISGNNGPGITVNGSSPTGNVLHGNIIGLDASGLVALPNRGPGILLLNTNHQTIGDTAASATNYISGNMSDGIELRHSTVFTNRIRANYIGLDQDGLNPVPNGGAGIFINGSTGNRIGGLERKYGNFISGNSIGIRIDSGAKGDTIISNYIGSDAASFGEFGNTTDGILVANSSGNMIGSIDPQMGNSIRYNKTGITVRNSTGVTIWGNSLYSDRQGGIKLVNGNNMQPAPKLDSAVSSGGNTTIYGKLHAEAAKSFHIEYFKNETCPPSSGGEGKTFIGTQTVTTDASGNAMLSFTAPGMFEDSSMTATATDPGGNTSQFSPCLCCAEVRTRFTPDVNGFLFDNTAANTWPPRSWVDYLDGKHAGLIAMLHQIGYDDLLFPDQFPSWDTWADAFGDAAVYLRPPPNPIYSQKAVEKWKSRWEHHSGSCEGFSIASLLELLDLSTFPLPYLRAPSNDTIVELINKYYLYQFSAESAPYLYYGPGQNPADMVDSLRRSLQRDPSRYQPLGLYAFSGDGSSSGHSVVAYRIKCDTTARGRVDSVFIYDSNHPNDSTRAVAVWRDESPVVWVYSGFGAGFGKGFLPDIEIGTFAHGKKPTLPASAPPYGKHPQPMASDPSCNIDFGDSARVTVSDKAGHSIASFDTLTGTMPNAGYVIPKTGGRTRVMGFHFLQADPTGWNIFYKPQNASLQNFLSIGSSALTTYFFFKQTDLNSAQKFSVNVPDQSLSLKAGAPSTGFGLSMIWNANGGENSVNMLHSSLSKNDSLHFKLESSTNNFLLMNSGTAKQYDLSLRHATSAVEMNKNFSGINLGGNELHTLVVGNWDNLDTTTILIKIDRGMNGTTDSTIVLQSGTASVHEKYDSEFSLSVQRIRIGARITYMLSKDGSVSLRVIDGLGREVAMPIEERQSSGIHEFDFNQTMLESGVYLYLLTSEGKTAVQKAIWIK